MIADFKKDCVKRNAKMLFRIHWDGDFFNDTYAYAWKTVIDNNTDVQFWVYTRVKSAALILKDISNLSLYYSTDDENKEIGHEKRCPRRANERWRNLNGFEHVLIRELRT